MIKAAEEEKWVEDKEEEGGEYRNRSQNFNPSAFRLLFTHLLYR